MFKAVAYAGITVGMNWIWGQPGMKAIISYFPDKKGVTKKYMPLYGFFSVGSAERGATHHPAILTPYQSDIADIVCG